MIVIAQALKEAGSGGSSVCGGKLRCAIILGDFGEPVLNWSQGSPRGVNISSLKVIFLNLMDPALHKMLYGNTTAYFPTHYTVLYSDFAPICSHITQASLTSLIMAFQWAIIWLLKPPRG